MEKTYIFGSESSKVWCSKLGELIQIPTLSINDNSAIHNFIVDNIKNLSPNSKFVLDLDSTNPALILTLALHIRLSIVDIKEKAFAPILLVSDFSLQSFLSLGECSQFFLSQSGYAFCLPEEVRPAINAIKGITVDGYVEEFLSQIQIHPDATIGNHSMANQWGADVLYRIVCKDDSEETEQIKKEKTKLYYKYIYLKTVPIKDVLSDKATKIYRRNEMCNATQKKILLIDDEAEKGWASVMKNWLFGYAAFDVVNQQIEKYEDIPEDIKKKISKDYYDLYLLDLRLRGVQEEGVYEAEGFSGMKVLRSIKALNVGNQVIIMTASNKAWNMKSLLDAGADGYYIKESPELQLPKSFSEANFRSFSRDVKKSLDSGYKKVIYKEIIDLKRDILSSTKICAVANEIISIMASAQNQLQRALSKNDFAYSYLSLFQVLELISRDFITPDSGTRNAWLVNNDTPLYYYETDGHIPVRQGIILEEWPSIKRKITGIYVDVCGGADCRFLRENLFLDVDRRNAFVHNDNVELADPRIAKVFSADGFIHLLSTIRVLFNGIL